MKLMNKMVSALILSLGVSAFSYAATADSIVGPASGKMADNTVRTLRLTQDGSLANQETHSRYLEATIRKNTYTCANPGGTAVATQAGLSATTPALTLWNPNGSGVNLVINTVSVGFTAVPTTTTFMLAVSTGTGPAPMTVTAGTLMNNLVGNLQVGQAQCYRIATLASAPLMVRNIGGVFANAVNLVAATPLLDHVDGEIVIGPGQLATIQTTASATILGAISFEEVPQ